MAYFIFQFNISKLLKKPQNTSLILKVLLDIPQTFQYNIGRGDNMIYREHYI